MRIPFALNLLYLAVGSGAPVNLSCWTLARLGEESLISPPHLLP